MAHRYGEGIGGIQVLRFKTYVQSLLEHRADLLLRSRAVAGNGLLSLARGIFVDSGYSVLERSYHGRSLGPAELEHHLGVLAIEWRLQGHLGAVVRLADLGHGFVDLTQLRIRVGVLPQVQHTHIHEYGLAVYDVNDPETQQTGSGVYSYYSSLVHNLAYGHKFNQSCRIPYKDAGLPE